MKNKAKSSYKKPLLVKLDSIRDVTFECPDFQCSITIPPPPAP